MSIFCLSEVFFFVGGKEQMGLCKKASFVFTVGGF